jgi:hypothetical protein
MRVRLVSIGLVAFAFATGSAFACGDEPPANLVASPATKAALRVAYLRSHTGWQPEHVAGPVRGRTYYGTYGGTEFAVATFVTPASSYPTIFERTPGSNWHAVRDTHGGICTNWVPRELIRVWSLRHWGGSCFVEPS